MGCPRVPSRCPKAWRKQVYEALHSASDMDRARLEEIIVRLSECTVRRPDIAWDGDKPWLENAQTEHSRAPFRAMLATSNPSGHPAVLVVEDLEEDNPLWDVPRGRLVSRSAADLAGALSPMLRLAEEIVFVDPHFGPENRRHREPLKAFLRAATCDRPGAALRRVEVQCAADSTSTMEFFRGECLRSLPRCIPQGIRVDLIRLRERQPDGEKLHNRYLLTNLGGVSVGIGLDEGPGTQFDDLNVLTREQYEKRWKQYCSDDPEFERPEGVLGIQGEAAH